MKTSISRILDAFADRAYIFNLVMGSHLKHLFSMYDLPVRYEVFCMSYEIIKALHLIAVMS